MTRGEHAYLSVPRLEAIPWLVHGFGDAGWCEADFLAFAGARDLKPVIMRQLHSDRVHRLESAPAGKLEGDALMTDVEKLLLVIRTADCLPVLLVDTANRAVAAVHCGWRGTVKGVLGKTVRAMARAYGSEPAKMLAALGPCIGSACYEVGPEVRGSFLRVGFPESVFTVQGHIPEGHVTVLEHVPVLKPKYLLDLRAANVWALRGLGFAEDHIFDRGPTCTHCEPTLLSYRRNPHDPRRMYNFIGLRRVAF